MQLQPASKPVSQSPFDVGEGGRIRGAVGRAQLFWPLYCHSWHSRSQLVSPLSNPLHRHPRSSAAPANFGNIQKHTCPSACWMIVRAKAKIWMCEVRGHPFKWRSESAVRGVLQSRNPHRALENNGCEGRVTPDLASISMSKVPRDMGANWMY